MDTSRQLPTHGDGPFDMREPARTLLESMVNEAMDAQADMPCGDGAVARDLVYLVHMRLLPFHES